MVPRSADRGIEPLPLKDRAVDSAYAPPRRALSVRLESKLQRELDHSRISRGAADGSVTRRRDAAARIREICDVQNVEELAAPFEIDALGDRDPLIDRDIEIALAWTAEDVAAAIAEQISGPHERGGIEVLV